MIHAGQIAGQTRVPISIGAIHFIGIGGIGMSGIAEVMRNLGYHVQGSDTADSANVKRLRSLGIPVAIGQRAGESRRRSGGRVFVRGEARQCGIGGRAQGRAPDRPPRRDAGRADAAQALRRHRRHAWQDHDDDHGGGPARRRRPRSDRRQWRHHQCLRHQCAARRRRLDGGGGRRIRRHLPAASRDGRGRHQRRSRTSRFLRRLRPREVRLPELRREPAVLRFRRDVHRPSRSAGDGGARPRPADHHLWLQPAGRCPRRQCRRSREGAAHFDVVFRDRRKDTETTIEGFGSADAGRAQCLERGRRDRRSRASSAFRPRRSARRSPSSAASGGASRASARGTARPSSTITATIPSRSRPC